MVNHTRKPLLLLICMVLFFSCLRDDPTGEKHEQLSANFLNDLANSKYDYKSGYPGFDEIKLGLGVDLIPSTMELFYDDHLRIPDFLSGFLQQTEENGTSVTAALHNAFRLLDAPAGGVGPPLAGTGKYYPRAILNKNEMEAITLLKQSIGLKFRDHSMEEWKKIPESFRFEILKSIFLLERSHEILMKTYPPSNDKIATSGSMSFSDLIQPWKNRELTNFDAICLIKNYDLKELSYASRILAEQVNRLIKAQNITFETGFSSCIINTELGEIGIFGEEIDTIQGAFALLVDIGGNDVYGGQHACPMNSQKPISMVVDFKGNDIYKSEKGNLVSGIQGIGILCDMEGDDTYSSNLSGLGFSMLGTSILFDAAGDDVYECKSDYSMASAICGVSILLDASGNDVYLGKNMSMGFGSTMGVGLLIDFQGNDNYNIKPVTQESKLFSFVQGAAAGRWAEASDGHSLGGGYGFLLDFDGDDNYAAKSFSQGAAYYFGFGACYDRTGKDNYMAISHSQGYAAHFANGIFLESMGNDMYNKKSDSTAVTQIMGSGRDYSAGWFIELSGNDQYNFGNRSIGIGDLKGNGYFWEHSGDDTYNWFQNSLNKNTESMGKVVKGDKMMGINKNILIVSEWDGQGIFLDRNGNNSFREKFVHSK